MNEQINLTACDREPIHIPGSIQPHGFLLVARKDDLSVVHAAGDVEQRIGFDHWRSAPLQDLIGTQLVAALRGAAIDGHGLFVGQYLAAQEQRFDVIARATGEYFLIEFDPAGESAASASVVLANLEASSNALRDAQSVQALCDAAAREFRKLTGFDRVMVYQFSEDDSGYVVAEDRNDLLGSYLNHHFPATDIPRQARALYVRNLVRVIPDVNYSPAPLRPAETGEPLDMSDCVLRSVSPIHVQYLKNMGVAASASVSIVIDDKLWGLIACHHTSPRGLCLDIRSSCRALAGALAQQIKARGEAQEFREQLRLKSFESGVIEVLARDGRLADALSNHVEEARRMMRSDGIAVLRAGEIVTHGACPDATALHHLATWIVEKREPVFYTDRLPEHYPAASAFREVGSGLLAITFLTHLPWIALWFRAEQAEVVNWAGNPHKPFVDSAAHLTPRASFDLWRETVHGRSRKWSLAEADAASRLRSSVLEMRQSRRIAELNRQLTNTLRDKDALLEQKQYLIGEINHRVQNSLQLVSSFLELQSRESENPEFKNAVKEAKRRLQAVALMHRRLYRGDELGTLDLGRYLEEVCAETLKAMDPGWSEHFNAEFATVTVPANHAVSIGLILTELITNTNKYAYGGGVGPLLVRLTGNQRSATLIVADRGGGLRSERKGFGSRLMEALTSQLSAEMRSEDNEPGLRVTLRFPLTRD